MKAHYDPDATSLTRSIYQSLRWRGYPEWAAWGLGLQGSIEDELFSAVDDLRRHYEGGEFLTIWQGLEPYFEEGSTPQLVARDVLRRFSTGDPNAQTIARDILAAFMQWLPPQDATWEFRTPVNLLVALDVLFRVTVLRRRMARHAVSVFRDILQADVLIRGNDGIEESLTAIGSQDEREDGFWHLISMVIDRWDLRHLVSRARAGTQGALVVWQPEDVEDAAAAQVALLWGPMVREMAA